MSPKSDIVYRSQEVVLLISNDVQNIAILLLKSDTPSFIVHKVTQAI